jgi:hypothetical protein
MALAVRCAAASAAASAEASSGRSWRSTGRSWRLETPPHARVAAFMSTVIDSADDAERGRIQSLQRGESLEASSMIVHHFGSATSSQRSSARGTATCRFSDASQPSQRASRLTGASRLSEAGPAAPRAAAHAAFLRPWTFRALESEKEEATLKAQSVPWLVRKMLARITPERRFALNEEGQLLMRVKAVSGAFNEFCCVDGWTSQSNLFGYAVTSTMSWEGDVIHMENRVVEDGGKGDATHVTRSLHYLDASTGELVNESVSHGVSVKTWFTAK